METYYKNNTQIRGSTMLLVEIRLDMGYVILIGTYMKLPIIHHVFIIKTIFSKVAALCSASLGQ